jgi:hypothetical protein
MGLLDRFAHSVVVLVSTFASAIINALQWGEGSARSTMSSAGLHGDLQTVVLIFVVGTVMLAVSRLLHGRLRTGLVLVLMLTLAHVCSTVAHGVVVG